MYRNNLFFVDILYLYTTKKEENQCQRTVLYAPAAVRASQSINASFSAKMRCATLALRSIPRSVIAAASGCTAETHDKSITAQFVHNAVDKFITNPTESNAFSGIFTF